MNLLLRADASPRIGTGHVMRCLALAQAWQDAGGRASFASDDLPPALRDRVVAEGYAVEPAAAPGTSEDAARTAALAKGLRAEWVVLDGYRFGGDFQQALKEADRRVLVVDDFGHAGRYPADLVLNQNLGADERLYAQRGRDTRLLLGPRFALLRREFTRPGWQRQTPGVARKVLVTLGGADPDNATGSVIAALSGVKIEGLEAIVVVGPANPHRAALEAAARESPARIEVRADVSDMPALMRWADVAVAAGGSTSWERARFGLPALVLVLADNQEPVAAALGAGGLGWDLGWHHQVGQAELTDALERLLRDRAARETMARRGPELVDGRGAERVTQIMTGAPRLRLRPATAEDARLLWEWVNEPSVRQVSFNPDPIPWEGHLDWLARRLADPDSRIYIAEDDAGRPVGQVRFDRNATGEAEIAVSVSAERRGGGTGAALIRAGVEKVFGDRWVLRVNAHIKPENAASLGCFRKAGFTVVGEGQVRGHRAIHAVREAH
jgi:UDP-2,4-diacetamido-2,4,6-trideoxy-beta-L-altropyranose hydrolase